MKNFSHLHIHSEFSILSGVGGVEKWFSEAKKKGIKALAFTEYSNLSSSMSAYLESKKTDVKAIFGTQILVVDDLATNTQEDSIVLIARNQTGYNNLLKLNEYSWTDGYSTSRQNPRVDYKTLKKYKKGLYCLSGSATGPIAVSLKAGYQFAEAALKQLHKIYGNRFRIEIQLKDDNQFLNKSLLSLARAHKILCVITNDCHHPKKGEHLLEKFIQDISRHSVKYSGKEYSDINKHGWLKGYKQLNSTRDKEHSYITQRQFDEMIDNTNDVSDNCNVEIPVGKPCFPKFDVESHELYKDGLDTGDKLFEYVARDGFKKKVLNVITDKKLLKTYKKRFEFELSFIKDEAKFSDYFLIIDDIVRFAKRSNIEAGAARGSCAGSLLAYCMFTDIDPIKYDLMFERFLNPARLGGYKIDVTKISVQKFEDTIDTTGIKEARFGKKLVRKKYKVQAKEEWQELHSIQKKYLSYLLSKKKSYDNPNHSWILYGFGITDVKPTKNTTYVAGSYPDVDLDFERVLRPVVKQYVIDKYGANSVCTIGSYGTLQLKGIIRDAHRVFEGELPVTETESATFDIRDLQELIRDLDKDKVATLSDALKKSNSFKRFQKKFPFLVDYYFARLDGQVRNLSKHAAAVLITPTVLTDYIPVRTQKIEGEEDRVLVSQWQDSFCEKRGLLKLDILGIKTLNVFKKAKEIINKKYDKKIDFTVDVDIEDEKVLAWFNRGETEGVFQFNSNIQSKYLKKLNITSFEDLIVTNAILRPGPMDMDSHTKYIELAAGNAEPKYDHPDMEEHLKDTYSLLVFQEQMMLAANVLGGLTLAEADIMRAAMKKKDMSVMNKVEKQFITGCEKKGISNKKAKRIWDKLAAFSAYGFNRCINRRSLITLADGKEIPIMRMFKQFEAGKQFSVKSFNPVTNKVENHKVKEVVHSGNRRTGRLKLKTGHSLILTSRHGVGTDRGFRLFAHLRKTDRVYVLSKENKLGLADIDYGSTYYEERYKEETYDIVMDGEPRNFFANKILVHNSHSASYSFIGFICQWLKVHYPLAFWAATLEFASEDKKKPENVWSYRSIAKKYGIEFDKPKATRKRADFHIIKNGKIAWPIRAINGIGIKSADIIASTCKEHKPKTFADFYEVMPKRQVNKKVMAKLIASDAFSQFGTPREIAEEYFRLKKEKEIPEQFLVSEEDENHWISMRDDALGFMEQPYRVRFKRWFSKQITPIPKLEGTKNGKMVIVGGRVKRVFPFNSRAGKMYFVTVYDADGEFLLLIFPAFYKKNKKAKVLQEGDFIEALGNKDLSNRGETEVVLKGNSSSQLEVLENI